MFEADALQVHASAKSLRWNGGERPAFTYKQPARPMNSVNSLGSLIAELLASTRGVEGDHDSGSKFPFPRPLLLFELAVLIHEVFAGRLASVA
jgi:hypothetical protein